MFTVTQVSLPANTATLLFSGTGYFKVASGSCQLGGTSSVTTSTGAFFADIMHFSSPTEVWGISSGATDVKIASWY